jgi:YgiT-type zinc finger domain-containing protein
MNCIHCKGTMTRGRAPFSADRGAVHVLWDALPAWVCEQCGEAYFEAAEVERIQRSLAALDRANVVDAA